MNFDKKSVDAVTEITKRIKKLMQRDGNRRQILRMKYPWDLHRLGLRVDDLKPSYAEVVVALKCAQQKGGQQ